MGCEAGHYLDQFTELCLPCGHGRYQENKGKFGCDLCEVGKTTRTKNALSKDECRDDCPDGQQLSFTGECETCPVGTYRTQGLHRGCQNCQSGRTSLRPGSTSEADCSVQSVSPVSSSTPPTTSAKLVPLALTSLRSSRLSALSALPTQAPTKSELLGTSEPFQEGSAPTLAPRSSCVTRTRTSCSSRTAD